MGDREGGGGGGWGGGCGSWVFKELDRIGDVG